MTEALQRMIGRANGRVQANLRPRQAARFETGETGMLTEVLVEQPYVPPMPAPAPAAHPPPPVPPPQMITPGPAHAFGHPPAAHLHGYVPPAPEAVAPPVHPPPFPLEPQAAVPAPQWPHFPAVTPPALMPETPLNALSMHAHQLHPVLPPVPDTYPPHPVPPVPAPRPAMPPPLLSTLPVPALNLPPVQMAPAVAPAPPDAAMSEPDINVEIGRLDIRAAPATPRRQRASKTPSPGNPSLADYLRGDGK